MDSEYTLRERVLSDDFIFTTFFPYIAPDFTFKERREKEKKKVSISRFEILVLKVSPLLEGFEVDQILGS